MAIEQELKNENPVHKEFQNLLDKDFKDRKLKENEIIVPKERTSFLYENEKLKTITIGYS